MRRFCAAFAAISTVVAFSSANVGAAVIEVGQLQNAPLQPSCATAGSPCLAVSRTTGYQAKVGTLRGLMTVPQSGRLVAWTIAVAKPTTKQINFFEKTLGYGPSQAGITVLSVKPHLHDTVKAQSPIVALEPYFGSTVQFPLVNSISVKKGDLIALTVPSWAPALQVNLPTDTSWRAARDNKKCKDTTTQTAQLKVGDQAQYACLYKTARLTYTATVVTYPKQSNKPKKPAKPKKKTRAIF